MKRSLIIVYLLAVLVMLLYFFFAWFSDGALKRGAHSPPTLPLAAKELDENALDVVLSRNLFGGKITKPGDQTALKNSLLGDAQASSLQGRKLLRLLAVATSADGRFFSVISASTKDGRLVSVKAYFSNDKLPDGRKLQRVFADGVTIEDEEGVRDMLLFKEVMHEAK